MTPFLPRWSALSPTRFPCARPRPSPRLGDKPLHLLAVLAFLLANVAGAATAAAPSTADRATADYFRAETARVAAQSLADIKTLRDWTDRRAGYREELLEMLGLAPLPARTDLKATITGRVEHEQFFVEKLHYQSSPGLYVTANLYVPKNLGGKKVPAILYVCGHGNVKQDGVSYGAKAVYQHHGAWFARHGYVCLILDTIQLGELEGLHHGTYREGLWWWNARGYTPQGVETWNSIRALDYLQSRPEVDGDKLGMTGRSGGGGYTWYTAALDERVKAAVPVAGITDLHNHVVDGTVAGHCDCMFFVNTFRWDYAKLAAMVAPRPLLFSNTDKDAIFPLDGVQRVHRDLARLYALHRASDKLGLLITEGPHKDTQELQVPAFRWFNRWLKGVDTPITVAAEKLFTPQQLKVFPVGELPRDQRTTKIHETFVPMAAPAVPANSAEWTQQREAWMAALREKVFRGWPKEPVPLALARLGESEAHARRVTTWEFNSQENVRLRLTAHTTFEKPRLKKVYLQLMHDWRYEEITGDKLTQLWGGEIAVVYFHPRGLMPSPAKPSEREQVQIRRRYMLLGQTEDGMRVWDIQRAVAALRSAEMFGSTPIILSGWAEQDINVLYASLFVDGLDSVELFHPPVTHMKGPDYLNVLRFLDIPQAAAMAAERQPIKMLHANPDDWSWTTKTAQQLRWSSNRLTFD